MRSYLRASFQRPVRSSQRNSRGNKKNEDVDMIACVSHSGTWEDEKVSEDEILAKNVPDIDLIVSGHTHTQLAEPILQEIPASYPVENMGKTWEHFP